MMELNKKHSEIKNLIEEHSPFSEKETNRMLNKFFGSVPTNIRILVKKYQFDKKKILDIGCGYGQSLLYWNKNSEGIEISDYMIKFLKSLDKTVHKLNVEDGFLNLKEQNYDAVYSNNLIEHLISPHLFLIRLHPLLKKGGILAIGHPVIPPFISRNLCKLLGYRGWLAVEHVNFFTPQTARLTLERAGFKVKEQYFPGVSRINLNLSKMCVPIGVHVLSICQKIDDFKYPSKRLAEFNPSWAQDFISF